MDTVKFEWNENKNELNQKKYKISFEEAKTVFYDEEAYWLTPQSINELICWWYVIAIELLKQLYGLSPQERLQKMKQNNITNEVMNVKAEYDFTNARKNPYAKKLKKQITINIDSDTIEYFKAQSESSGIPYQTLINLYLADCAANHKQLQLSWN